MKNTHTTDEENDAAIQKEVSLVANYARNIYPKGLSLSRKDIIELCDLVDRVNSEVVSLYIANMIPIKDIPLEVQKINVKRNIRVEYNYKDLDDNVFEGIDPNEDRLGSLPENIKNFFVSNATFSKRHVNETPPNEISIFLDFSVPSLRIDTTNIASNATPNTSIINIVGRDESWVLATEKRLNDFLKSKKNCLPFVHMAGAFDYLTWILLFPVSLWLALKFDEIILTITASISTITSVLVALYIFLFALFSFQIIFKFARRLFPPMEYHGTGSAQSILKKGVLFCHITIFDCCIFI